MDGEELSAAGSLQVVGDTIEFTAGSDEERPWLFDADGSQLNNGGRYADNGTHFTYRFTLPAGVTGGTVTLDMGNQFLVSASTDGTTWTEVLRENREIRDLSNRQEYSLDSERPARRGPDGLPARAGQQARRRVGRLGRRRAGGVSAVAGRRRRAAGAAGERQRRLGREVGVPAGVVGLAAAGGQAGVRVSRALGSPMHLHALEHEGVFDDRRLTEVHVTPA